MVAFKEGIHETLSSAIQLRVVWSSANMVDVILTKPRVDVRCQTVQTIRS